MYYLLIIERLNGVALFESNNNNFKNLNRIKNRKEKRLKGGKKKKDIFPIGRINIGAIEKREEKKIRTIFDLGNVSHDEVRNHNFSIVLPSFPLSSLPISGRDWKRRN